MTSFPLDSKLRKIIIQIRLIVFDFDGVFTDNTVYVSQNGEETVRCFRSDGIGLEKLRTKKINTIVITSEINPVASVRCKKLNIKCIRGCKDKLATLKSAVKRLKLSLKQVAFVGNDINDISCLSSVGLPIVVADAHKDVKGYAKYITRIKGGFGAVREICDLFEYVICKDKKERAN